MHRALYLLGICGWFRLIPEAGFETAYMMCDGFVGDGAGGFQRKPGLFRAVESPLLGVTDNGRCRVLDMRLRSLRFMVDARLSLEA